ncbi:MAG: DMT family transporter [Phocaeicola sp.]
MKYLGELISLSVAFSWTITALFSEVASKRLGTLQLNVIRMTLSLIMLSATLFYFTGSPYPVFADSRAWFWLSLSGFIGYVLGDYCLFNAYVLIGSRFAQLFMTIAPLAAALSAWAILGEYLSLQAWGGIFVTLFGISLSVLGKGGKRKVGLNIPLKGVLFGIGGGMGQGIGLVLSKIGMNYYTESIPVGLDSVNDMLPFASTFIRAITGLTGFIFLMGVRNKFPTLLVAIQDKKGMQAATMATLFGPFVGVSLSLMAVQYTEAGIASTLMALTPILILWPTYLFFKQRITLKEVIGACISVMGASLFFM